MNGSLETHLQSIEDFLLVEDKIVTYKWISKKLQVHINTAKQLLYAFSSKEDLNTKLLVTYLIGGEGKNDSGLKFCLVKKEDLDNVINSFKKIICNHVYSIQRDSNVDASTLYNADSSYELNEEDKKFSSIQKNDEIVKRDLNINVTVPIQPSEVKSTSTSKKEKLNNDYKKVSEEQTSETKSDSPKSSGDNIKESKRSISPVKAIKTSPIKPGAIKNKKLNQKNGPSKGGGIGTFFSKQAANAAKKKEIQAKVETEEKDREEVKENIGKTNSQQEENKMEVEVKNKEPKATPPVVKKENPKKRKKRDKESELSNKRRKRIKIASDSESSSSESEMEVEVEREPTPEPVPEVLKESDEEIIPPTPSEKGRKRVKKLVDKTYTDEDGYIVTSKVPVIESCSDDEVPVKNNKEENHVNEESTNQTDKDENHVKESSKQTDKDENQVKESTKQTENNKSETSSDKTSQKGNKFENKKKKKSPIKSPKKSPKKSPTKNKQKTIMNFFKRK